MIPRAFTLLETLLAAALGSIVVLVAAGLMWSISATDRRLEVRYRQLAEIRGVRLTMERAFGSLLMSEQPIPNPPREQTNTLRWDHLKSLRQRGSEEIPPDRLRLGVSGGGVAPGLDVPLQRLEIVLTDPPVPSPKAQAAADAMVNQLLSASTSRRSSRRTPESGDAKAGGDDRNRREGDARTPGQGEADRLAEQAAQEEDADFAVRATRGAFELRPGMGDEVDSSLELWWVPLPRVGTSPDEVDAMSVLDEPYRIAKELRSMRWRVFRERVWHNELAATWSEELPAYIEVDVVTTGGLTANWLFEVGYARGPELRRRSTPADHNAPAVPTDSSGKPQTPPPAGGGK